MVCVVCWRAALVDGCINTQLSKNTPTGAGTLRLGDSTVGVPETLEGMSEGSKRQGPEAHAKPLRVQVKSLDVRGGLGVRGGR